MRKCLAAQTRLPRCCWGPVGRAHHALGAPTLAQVHLPELRVAEHRAHGHAGNTVALRGNLAARVGEAMDAPPFAGATTSATP